MVECRGGPTVYVGTHPRGWTWSSYSTAMCRFVVFFVKAGKFDCGKTYPKTDPSFCFSTWGEKHTPKRTPETDLRIIPLRQTSRFGNVILRHNHVQGSGKYIQAAPISLFFFLIAWGRLSKFAPDFFHFCVESSESRKVLGVGQRQILLAATWITSNDGSSLVGLRRRPWFCMAAVQCRPCTREVNRPPRLVNVSTTTR